MDLYAILEVSPEANADEIKAAFRRLAKVHHPDKQGERHLFEQVNTAYKVLSDEKLRRAYDETGEYPGDQKTVEKMVTDLFLRTVEAAGLGADVLDIVRKSIEKHSQHLRDEMIDYSQTIEKLKKQRRKIIAKGQRNVFHEALDRKIAEQCKRIVEREGAIDLGEKMLEFLDGYEWTTDPAPQSPFGLLCSTA